MAERGLPAAFHRLLTAAVASNLGDGIRLTALPLLAATLTRDPLAIGAVTTVTMLPWLLGPVGGALVDRGDRVRLMQIGQVARGVAVVLLGLAVLTMSVELWMLYAVGFAIGLGEVVVDSALQAAVPGIVGSDQLEQANGRMIAGMTVSGEVVGGPLGGVLFQLSAGLPFLVDGVTFAVAAVVLIGIQSAAPTRSRVAVGDGAPTTGTGVSDGVSSTEAPPPAFWDDVREGLRALWDHDLLRPLAGVAGLVNVGTSAMAALLVLLALEELGLSEAGFGFLLGAGALGGLAGSLAADGLRARHGRPRALLGASTSVAAGMWVVALAPNGPVAALGLALITFAGGIFNVVGRSLRQAVLPEELLGRVIASFRVIGVGGMAVGAMLGGLLARLTSVQVTLVLAAVLLTVTGALMTGVIRRIPAEHA